MTGNEKAPKLKCFILIFISFVFVAGCVMAPQRTDTWIGRAFKVKLPCGDEPQVSAVEFEIVGSSTFTNNSTDLFCFIHSGMGYHNPILVNRHGTILPADFLPTNTLIWVKGELGTRRRVKLPDRSRATFDGHSELAVISLYLKAWGRVVEEETSSQ